MQRVFMQFVISGVLRLSSVSRSCCRKQNAVKFDVVWGRRAYDVATGVAVGVCNKMLATSELIGVTNKADRFEKGDMLV